MSCWANAIRQACKYPRQKDENDVIVRTLDRILQMMSRIILCAIKPSIGLCELYALQQQTKPYNPGKKGSNADAIFEPTYNPEINLHESGQVPSILPYRQSGWPGLFAKHDILSSFGNHSKLRLNLRRPKVCRQTQYHEEDRQCNNVPGRVG